jgi:AcrR family transcriptional regulator
MVQKTTTKAPRNYERAKAGRRSKIIDAARALIGETGKIGFSMRELADRSDLSLATPYNLFGSKGDILVQLYHDDLAQFERRVERLVSKTEIDRFFDVIDLSTKVYMADERFYRTIMGAIQYLPDKRLHRRISPPRLAFWEGVVRDAVEHGYLRAETSPHLIATVLVHIVRSVVAAWSSDDITLERLRAEMGYGFALVLHSVATKSGVAKLETRIEEFEVILANGDRPARTPRARSAAPKPAKQPV